LRVGETCRAQRRRHLPKTWQDRKRGTHDEPEQQAGYGGRGSKSGFGRHRQLEKQGSQPGRQE
jgi:hypothetical protein